MTSFKKRILVCDDQPALLKRLRIAVGNRYEIEQVYEPGVVKDVLVNRGPFHLLILDLGFPNPERDYENEVVGHLILEGLRERWPKLPVLISSALESEVVSPVLKNLLGVRQVQGWIDISEPAATVGLKLDQILSPRPALEFCEGGERGLWILHLSDLHFGRTFSTRKGKGITAEELFRLLREDLARFVRESEQYSEDGPRSFPHLCVVTGDLTHRARDEEFAAAESFLASLSQYLGEEWGAELVLKERANVIVIPGNHDVNWDISRARSVDKRDGKWVLREEDTVRELDYLKRYMWSPFEEFVRKFHGKSGVTESFCKESAFRCRVVDFSELLNVIVISLGSAGGIDHVKHFGEVGEKCLEQAESLVNELDPDEGALRILAVHHSLCSDAQDKDKLNRGDQSALRDFLWRRLKTPVVMSGHIHEDGLSRLDVRTKAFSLWSVGSGTLAGEQSERAPESTLKYNLLHFHGSGSGDRRFRKMTIYGRHFADDSFKADMRWEDRTSSSFTVDLLY